MPSMTELEAVNQMLRSIGDDQLDVLDTTDADTMFALQTLRDAVLSLQAKGWSFNRDENKTFPLSTQNKIELGTDILSAIPTNRNLNYVQRGTRLYDRLNHTTDFTGAVQLDTITFIAWSELPYSFQDLCTKLACYEYANSKISSEFLEGTLRKQFQNAYEIAIRDDRKKENPKFINGLRNESSSHLTRRHPNFATQPYMR